MPQDQAPAWVVPLMRTGHAARALVYVTIGTLAVSAAFSGGQAPDRGNALAELQSQTWGGIALWLIGLGFIAYMLWRLVCAFMDLEDHGTDGKGIAARIGQAVTGIVHGAIGLSVLTTAIRGGGSGGSGGGTQSMTAELMQLPFGPWLVGIVGLLTIGAGIYYLQKGIREKYKQTIRVSPTTQKLDPVMKAGFVAQGIVVGIIGGLILYAAITADPSQAGGIGAALNEIRSVAFGRILLGLIGIGLVAFAVENVVEAIYRIVPRRAGGDVTTLAQKAKREAGRASRKATT